MLKTCSRSLYPSWLALACLLFTSVLHAETVAPPIAPERFQMLEKALQVEVDQGRLAGIAVLVEQDGKLLHRSQHGYQDIAGEVPLAEDTLYKIFSLTKPVTSVAMLMLQEQGKLSLDDPLAKYLPEFADLKVAVADGPDGIPQTAAPTHAPTLRELMNQTAGFSYGVFSQSQVDTLYLKADLFNTEQTLEAMVGKLAKLPLLNQPGTAWNYSLSVDIQARVVEVVSGQPYEQFLAENIFKPLGMKDTGYHINAEQAPRLAVSYKPGDNGLEPQDNTQYLTKPKLTQGGSGLISSMDDYLRFARMLLNGGELDGVRLLSAESINEMARDQLPPEVDGPNWAPGNRFGLNVAVVEDSAKAGHLPVGTYWWWGIQGPWMWVDPSNNRIVMGMMQNTDYRHSRVVHGTVSRILFGER
ncbi:serine hydrolase domain-containing protein [Halopseudomonas bauzanensis]|uniref:Beta-lactamase family protein n=1 Tax=Halopseudomonas bauzanensis TaxID=653930 RepID=A0A4U0YKI6_9GAMM|nr:serine hydrolase domain-containing protein [Halopseudomonas bauzanensis]TKA92650.1 beta-lactamase family protein [Halopseudomonas bauzanensis]